MYKLLVAATLLTSAVNGQSYGGSSYGESSKGGMSEGSYSSGGSSYMPKAEMPKAEMPKEMPSYEAPKQEYKPPMEMKPEMGKDGKPCKTGEAGVHDVMVGGDAGLLYTPSSIMANVGDKVRFHFLMKNHTVTQSTFDKPCKKKEGGTDSNFKPSKLKNEAEAMGKEMDSSLMWEYKVESMEPTWWYCKQKTGTHCGKGMVFAINPSAEKSFEKFKMEAQKQNGTGEATPPPPPPSGGEYKPPSGGSPPPPPPSMQPGYNAGSGGACSCQCLCGTASFPSGSGWGVGMEKGMPGVAEAPWGSMESKPAEGGAYAAPPAETKPAEGGAYAAPPAESKPVESKPAEGAYSPPSEPPKGGAY